MCVMQQPHYFLFATKVFHKLLFRPVVQTFQAQFSNTNDTNIHIIIISVNLSNVGTTVCLKTYLRSVYRIQRCL